MADYEFETPTHTWECGCGETVECYRGQGDQQCSCGQWFSASGQPLRIEWMSPSSYAEWVEPRDEEY